MQGTSSLIASLASQPLQVQQRILASLTDDQAEELLWDWLAWARPSQIPPDGDWKTWLILAGRGAGKTRSGAEWVRAKVKSGCSRIALIAPTAADARDIMVEGESGILSVCWDKDTDANGRETGRPLYEPSKRRLTWANGALATLYSAEEPDRLRGPQHDAAWCDELAAWSRMTETWDMLQFGLRLGGHPQAMVTTTPRPVALLRHLVKDESTVITRGNTYDNAANLAPSFIDAVKARYEGTRLGRQELFAEILEDIPGALWWADLFKPMHEAPPCSRIVVAVDPSGIGSADDAGDSQGVVIAGKMQERDAQGRDQFVILQDATCRLSPAGWGRLAVEKYAAFKADAIVAERNFGGEMVRSTIRQADRNANVKLVTASRGKVVRAEPIAALYEQGRVHHMPGLEALEGQMMQFTTTGYVGERSPDRVDAAVWALSDLAYGPREGGTKTVGGLL